MCLVSVITPTHNSEKTIKETIESILRQTHPNIELIIVDDCSDDNTINIVNSFNDSRIVVLRNDKNYGAAYSRNRGIREAKGDYIAFLDADDVWDKTKLEKQLSFMIKNNYKFTYTNYRNIKTDCTISKKMVTGPKRITFRKFKNSDYVGCLTVMYKKDIYQDLQIPDDIYKRNDYALWLKLSQKTDCYLLDECLAYYRLNNGLSNGNKASLLKYHRIMFKKTLGYNSFHAFIRSCINVLFYFYRKIFYVKKYE